MKDGHENASSIRTHTTLNSSPSSERFRHLRHPATAIISLVDVPEHYLPNPLLHSLLQQPERAGSQATSDVRGIQLAKSGQFLPSAQSKEDSASSDEKFMHEPLYLTAWRNSTRPNDYAFSPFLKGGSHCVQGMCYGAGCHSLHLQSLFSRFLGLKTNRVRYLTLCTSHKRRLC